MPITVMSVLLTGPCYILAVVDSMCMLPGAVAQELTAFTRGKMLQKTNGTEQALVMANSGKVRIQST